MTDRSLIEEAGVGISRAAGILDEALAGAEDGEIYVESVRSESFLFDDGRRAATLHASRVGAGHRVRAVRGGLLPADRDPAAGR